MPTLYEGCVNNNGSKSYFAEPSGSSSGYEDKTIACNNATANCRDAPHGSALLNCQDSRLNNSRVNNARVNNEILNNARVNNEILNNARVNNARVNNSIFNAISADNGDVNPCGDSNSWTTDIKQCFVNNIKSPDITNDQAVCIVNNISQKYTPHMFNSLSQSQDSNLLAFAADVSAKCASDSTYNGNYDQSCNSDSDCDRDKSCKSGICKKTSGLSTMAMVGIGIAILVFLIICVFLVIHFSHSSKSSLGFRFF